MSEKTVFEKIIDRDIPADIWYEDDLVTVFFDINPVAFGHSLVISKSPYPWIQDVPPTELGQIFERIPLLVEKLKTARDADYIQLAVQGVDVPHFHLHLIPRDFGDKVIQVFPSDKASHEKEALLDKLLID